MTEKQWLISINSNNYKMRLKHQLKTSFQHLYLKTKFYFHNFRDKHQLNIVFLIGCGRSGTTILGQTIGNHHDVTYLNERRDIWHKVYPEFDIWSGKEKQPKLVVRSEDSSVSKDKRLNKLFLIEQVGKNGKVLLEKLPTNSFRLEYLNKAFPNAKYIYLQRNGLEVAKSIEPLIKKGKWLGKNDLKWQQLDKLVAKDPLLKTEKFSDYEKGLIEWRFSMQYSEEFFKNFDQSRYHSLTYDEFMNNPQIALHRIFNFLDLETSNNLLNTFSTEINRRSNVLDFVTERELFIAGDNLKRFVSSNNKK